MGIVKGSEITDAVLAKPSVGYEETLNVIHTSLYHAHLLWILPIYPSERVFLRTHGLNSLIDLFFENDTDISNFYRSRATLKT